MGDRENLLQNLKELRKIHNKIQSNQNRIKSLEAECSSLHRSVSSAEETAAMLPTDNAERKKRELESTRQSQARSAYNIKYWILLLSILALGVIAVVIIALHLDLDIHLNGNSSSTLPFSIVFVVGMLIWGGWRILFAFEDWFPFFRFYAVIFTFLFIDLFPLACFVFMVYGMFMIYPVLVLLPIAVLVLTILLAIHRNSGPQKTASTYEDQLAIERAEALDEANREANRIAAAEAGKRAKSKIQQKLDQLNQNITRLQSEIHTLQGKVYSIDLIHPNDIKYTDRLIYFIEHREADNIKEAIHLLRMEQEKTAKYYLDKIDRDWARWEHQKEVQQQQAKLDSLNAASERRAKDLEKKLDDLQKDFEYHQKNGW